MTSKSPMTGPYPLFQRLPSLLLLTLILLAGTAWNEAAAAPAKKGSQVDTAAVRRLYLDGEFDPAIALLENTLKSKSQFSHEDSVFVFKHLGVMYAAKYETREKGKLYMHKLLEAEPTARIMDMYASDMIYMIFKNIQDEFEASRRKFERAETNLAGGRTEPPPETGRAKAPPPREKARKGSSALIWMGAAAVAAGAVAIYYYSDDEPEILTTIDNHQPD